MCGTCDMGRKIFLVGPTFFVLPPPLLLVLLQEMAKPGREVRWEHVPTHANVQGNEVANGLAMEGMCSSPLWSQQVPQMSYPDRSPQWG